MAATAFGSESVRSHPLRGTPKNAAEGTAKHTRAYGWRPVVATAAAGVGNACSLSFREAPRLGRQARGKRACATIALRHDDASPQKWGYGDRIMMGA